MENRKRKREEVGKTQRKVQNPAGRAEKRKKAAGWVVAYPASTAKLNAGAKAYLFQQNKVTNMVKTIYSGRPHGLRHKCCPF